MLIQNNKFNTISNVKNISFAQAQADTTSASQPVTAKTVPVGQMQLISTPQAAIQYNDFVKNFLNSKVVATQAVTDAKDGKNFVWKNDLRKTIIDNKAVIYALVPRTFNAKDANGNEVIEKQKGEQIGNFMNAIERLDELKSLGVNTLHVLPIHPPGKGKALGAAGSIYAPKDYLEIDPNLADPNSPLSVDEQFKHFNDECHKRGIRVMLDVPSCASLDLYNARPDMMAIDEQGFPEVPQGWNDIRMLKPWADKENKVLNKAVLDYHKQFMDKYQTLGVDGFRVDVARAKPVEFWNELIPYARKNDPECAFLAESYTYEDASPMANVPADRPEDLLRAGFDTYYGQYHIFNEWSSAKEFHDNLILNLEMTERLPAGKSLIGSFTTHDDKSAMANGGVKYCNMTTLLQATVPMTNPYFVAGFESGDNYNYSYRDKPVIEAETDAKHYFAHAEKLDIFNYSRRTGGNYPEVGEYMSKAFNLRSQYEDILTKGSYIPLTTTNKGDKIIAYARHLNGKTLLVIANKDVNAVQSGVVKVPGLAPNQQLVDIAPVNTGTDKSEYKATNDGVEITLSPANAHVFEIVTPNIEKEVPKVYKQKL